MIQSDTRDRASGDASASEDNSTDSSSPWPKNGPAGQVGRAKRTAPEGADPLRILAVAHAADQRDVHPRQVWREIEHKQLGESR
jgi:hypothetical protein